MSGPFKGARDDISSLVWLQSGLAENLADFLPEKVGRSELTCSEERGERPLLVRPGQAVL